MCGNAKEAKRASYLRTLEGGVDGEPRAEARQRLDVSGGGEGPPALGEDGEGQGLEVLGVDVVLLPSHGLEQVLAGDDLREGGGTQ